MADPGGEALKRPPRRTPPIVTGWRFVRAGLEATALVTAYEKHGALAMIAKALVVCGDSVVAFWQDRH
ncbi:hypothetical protein [Planosporangium mesophilum]|uniref:Uncharacterized protein n=1 Tax=Planosporangium mesophilum TaxID=689768 RepID=A0A8J3TGH4_9ACTN|nr:hypothetical protein [Planosporangium mesophilum]NJC83686.1 hypothetical protein [Planosporangium mesophilum]GII25352.1 hypothetical protein Pme01_49490 [Planosporangium mesophilum]